MAPVDLEPAGSKTLQFVAGGVSVLGAGMLIFGSVAVGLVTCQLHFLFTLPVSHLPLSTVLASHTGLRPTSSLV